MIITNSLFSDFKKCVMIIFKGSCVALTGSALLLEEGIDTGHSGLAGPRADIGDFYK